MLHVKLVTNSARRWGREPLGCSRGMLSEGLEKHVLMSARSVGRSKSSSLESNSRPFGRNKLWEDYGREQARECGKRADRDGKKTLWLAGACIAPGEGQGGKGSGGKGGEGREGGGEKGMDGDGGEGGEAHKFWSRTCLATAFVFGR